MLAVALDTAQTLPAFCLCKAVNQKFFSSPISMIEKEHRVVTSLSLVPASLVRFNQLPALRTKMSTARDFLVCEAVVMQSLFLNIPRFIDDRGFDFTCTG
jgi:hypothetical protein